jgi:hypothetical protein
VGQIEHNLYVNVNTKLIVMAMVVAMAMVVPNYAVGGGCYDVGYEDGRNGDFERDAFTDNSGPLDTENRYYQGFIDGCTSVGENTRDVCESATD